ncbi:MAG TPA: toll/interleukin-1 receptor domain-containing protein, partial [Ktedonobacterales bacterium]|nr:toll/interleukin-1 receptor domain-containing protein [Ktedonobacterales bacterium]
MPLPVGNSGGAKRVFISHSHQDTAFCERLVQGLRVAGLDVWLDEHNLGAGHLPNIIEQELRNCD